MGGEPPARLILLVILSNVLSEGFLQYSLTDWSILSPEITTKHCINDNVNDSYSLNYYDHNNQDFRFNQPNNATGETTVTIPLHPSSDTRVKYSVTLDLCINTTDKQCYNQTDITKIHQTLHFSSLGENCTNKTITYIDLKLSYLWSQKYKLTVKPDTDQPPCNRGDPCYREYVFNVTNSFFTKPEPFRKKIRMSLTGVNDKYIAEVSFENISQPVRHMVLWLQKTSNEFSCVSTNRLVAVYINTEAVHNSSLESMRMNDSKSGNVSCTWSEQLKLVTCYFGKYSHLQSKDLMAVVTFFDPRCDNLIEVSPNEIINIYGNSDSDCCPHTYYNPTPEYKDGESFPIGLLIIIVASVFSFVMIIIGYHREWSQSDSYKLPRSISKEVALEMPKQEMPKPKVLLMYAIESNMFQSVITRLRQKLSDFCDVVDYCDTTQYEAVGANSWKWAQNQLQDISLPVVLVVTSCSLNLIENNLQYQRPSALTTIYPYVYHLIQTTCCNKKKRPIFVVRFEESLDTSMVLSERTYLLTKQLPTLVKGLINNTDLEVLPDIELDKSVADFRNILNQPGYQQSIFVCDQPRTQLLREIDE